MVASLAPERATGVQIPGLPDHLTWVPPAPDSPHDANGTAKREAWIAWSHDLSRYRVERKYAIAQNPDLIPMEREKCRRYPAYFLAVWGWIFEQRSERGGGEKPWLLFPAQIEMLNWLDARMESPDADRDGVISKCRDMGASWTFCGWATHGWLFRSPWTILLLSRKEELVESRSSDSLFWKIEFILQRLEKHAPWMLPEGFALSSKEWHVERKIINPVTGAELLGESTNTNAGRGSRATAVGLDEAAFIPDLLDIWNGLGASTNHRIAISSESLDEGPDFWKLGQGNKDSWRPALFEMDWWDNPLHDNAWLEREKQRYASRPEDFNREYLRDARAGTSTWVYPAAMDLQIEDIAYEPGYPLYVAIDPGMRDDTAIVWIQDQGIKEVVLASYQNRGKDAEFYGTILTGVAQSGVGWNYTDYDLEIMAWTKDLPPATYYGDNYGSSQMGSRQDSFYSVLRNKFNIIVNADRMADGSAVGYRKEVRFAPGRRQALRELIPRLRFSNQLKAGFVLQCLQENKFPPESGSAVTEQKDAIHDWTSHMCQAMGFYAAHRGMAHSMLNISKRRAQENDYRNGRDRVNDPRFNQYGRKTQWKVS